MRRSLLAVFLLWSGALLAQPFGLTSGPANFKSAEALTFGPDGILFIGDSAGGAVFAIDTADHEPAAGAPNFSITGIDQKIAGLLGTRPTEIRVHDIKVNPISKKIYLAISRGRGPDAIPMILRIDPRVGTGGSITELDTASIPYSRVELPGLPDSPSARRRLAITDLQYSDGQLIVAGLSNENFSSTLRVVPFPFQQADRGASVEIYHTSHFTYETDSPVRTMVPYSSGGEQYLLAAYTCTPLVRLRMSDLQSGAHVTGDTLAELGRHSSPIDMIHYQSQGRDFLLVANTSRGILKLSLGGLERYEPVTEDGGDDAQIPIQRVAAFKRVVQLDTYDATHALMLFDWPDRLDLQVVGLP